MTETIYLVKVTAREDKEPRNSWVARESFWYQKMFEDQGEATVCAKTMTNDTYYTRVYAVRDQLRLVKQFGGPKRVRPVRVVQPYTQEEGRRALQDFLRNVARIDGGRAVYGADVDSFLDQNKMSTVIQVGHPSVKNPRGIGVKAYWLEPKGEAAGLLLNAFGGICGLKKV